MTGVLKQIFRYPVKSMAGHSIDSAELGEWGILGDRSWTVKDEERGGIKGGKRFPELMAMKARFLEEPSADLHSPTVEITLPNDQVVRSDDPAVNEQLSDAVNSPLSLWPLLPKEQLDHYRRTPPPPGTDFETSLRETFARTDDVPLPDLSGFPKEVFEYESPPGTYFDAYPILIMTTGSLSTLADRKQSVNYDVRRFRPNLLVELAGEFPENAWVGKELMLGTAVLKVEMTCPRCIMTTHGFRDLPKDPKVMRELVTHNNGDLGVYCTVSTPGTVTTGDGVKLMN